MRIKISKSRPLGAASSNSGVNSRSFNGRQAGGKSAPAQHFAQHSALLSVQAKLEAARARFAALYNTAPVGCVTLSRSGLIEAINLPAAKLLGFTRRQLIRQPLQLFLARGDRPKFLRYLSQLCRFPGRRHLEVELARKKNSPAQFTELVTLGTPKTGETGSFQSVLIDITARRKAETALRESEERFRKLASHAPVGIFLCDTRGNTQYVNESWCAITGCTAGQAMGRGWLTRVHPEDRDRIANGWDQAVKKGIASTAEYRFMRPDGQVVWVQGEADQIKDEDGRCRSCIGTIADITERKKIHEEMLAASHAKDNFLAMLSHELRTPLNPVLLLAGDAARHKDLPEAVRADFDAIRKYIELEARLIDDLLDVTRITHGKLAIEKQSLDVHAVLRNAVAMVQNDVITKKINLNLILAAARHTVVGDSVRLQQVFWNVLKNAVKFTPVNGEIKVESSADGADLKVVITDTGVGIGSGDIESIFNLFAQGERADREGLGLGLAISRKLVELHAGTIRAASLGKGHGASFCVTLPLAQTVKIISGNEDHGSDICWQREQNKKPVRRARVLLVEDHEPTRTALARLLVRRKFEVTGAGSLAEVRSLVDDSQRQFDLLISDIGLPDGTGYDLMSELRQEQDVEGIALTGYGMEEDILRSYTAGFATHLTKPIKIESLDQALAAVLSRI